jgi:hypothetical protein
MRTLALAVALTLAMAAISWICLGRPINSFKRFWPYARPAKIPLAAVRAESLISS